MPKISKAVAESGSPHEVYRSPSLVRKVYLIAVILMMHFLPLVIAKTTYLDFIPQKLAPYLPPVEAWLASVVEPMWTSLLNRNSKFMFAFVGSFVIHQLLYYLFCMPGFVFQFLPFMDNYRIQPKRAANFQQQLKCLSYVLFSQICIQAPLELGTYWFTEMFNIPYEWAAMPSAWKLGAQLLGCSAIEDTWHFFIHLLAHHPRLYKYVHKVHHEYQAPFGMEAEYAHPVETLVLGQGFFLGILLYCNHVVLLWAWVALRLTETIEVHSGYDVYLPWNPLHFLPFYGGPRFHDFHHQNFTGNYSSSYTYWDELFGTDREYINYYSKKDNQGGHGRYIVPYYLKEKQEKVL